MVAVFLSDGFEDIEALSPVDYLRRGKAELVTVAVPSKTMKDKKIVTSSHNVSLFADMDFDSYMSEYGKNLPDAVVCPGGLNGARNLSANEILLEHIKSCFENGKVVAAICASPAVVLSKTGILKGKNWCCYPGMEETDVNPEDVEDSEFVANVPFVTDGNLVTGAGPGASEQFAMELVRIICGQEETDRIHKGALLR